MALKLCVAGLSEPGRERELNEDSFYYKVVQSSDEAPLGLFVVADGMGGQLAGEVASYWTVQTLKRELAQLFQPRDPAATRKFRKEEGAVASADEEIDLSDLIQHAVQRANEVVLEYADRKPDEAEGMGSTVTLVVIRNGQAVVANVGDSRTYLWRKGRLYQITHDHSVPGALLAAGKIQSDEVYTHEQRHLLYRCLGHKLMVVADIFPPIALQPGDTLVLCSDGLWEMLRSAGIAKALVAESDVSVACCQLVRAASEAGGEDDTTVLLVRVE